MIEATEASKQLARLSGLDFYPAKQDAALKELRIAAQSANTVAILESVITDWIGEQRECIKPADLRRMIWDRQDSQDTEAKKRTAACEVCNGTGWEIVTRNGLTGARTCQCRRVA